MNIAPPREHLELGARVRYHHRAAVIRKVHKDHHDRQLKPEHRYWAPTKEGCGTDCDRFLYRPDGERWSPFTDQPEDQTITLSNQSINKTIFVWPEEGEGIVIGLVRRGIGRSVSGSSGFNGESYDYEPGYFATHDWVWLYAVKTHLNGTEFIFVPMDAVKELD